MAPLDMGNLQRIAVEFYIALLENLSDHPARPLRLIVPMLMVGCPLLVCMMLSGVLIIHSRRFPKLFWTGLAILVGFLAYWLSTTSHNFESWWRATPTTSSWASNSLVQYLCGPDHKGVAPAPLPATGIPTVNVSEGFEHIVSHWRLGWPLHLQSLFLKEELHSWTPASIARKVPDFQVRLQHGYSEQQATHFEEQSFRHFLSNLDAQVSADTLRVPYLAEHFDTFYESPEYLEQVEKLFVRALLPRNASLEGNRFLIASPGNRSEPRVEVPDFLRGTAGLVWDAFWAGPAGARSGLHADPDPMNLLYQVYGTKTVTLFHPSERENLYVSEKLDSGATLSKVDPFIPNVTAFPNFGRAHRETVHLREGDVLFVPTGWFHFVTSETASISISGRLWSLCELTAFLPEAVWVYFEELGLVGEDTTSHWIFYDKAVDYLFSIR